ncbi:hypothetical protein IRJ41_023861 [Triplophysa rosa]|uniref:Uncharacterized protein n=1 Tax=Triplophysa rosa TaxID=992332 RepID=A0A9W8C855_TRIRA|nr:hypothetical protein IRJ41_023861 [Triplophysa rosa]
MYELCGLDLHSISQGVSGEIEIEVKARIKREGADGSAIWYKEKRKCLRLMLETPRRVWKAVEGVDDAQDRTSNGKCQQEMRARRPYGEIASVLSLTATGIAGKTTYSLEMEDRALTTPYHHPLSPYGREQLIILHFYFGRRCHRSHSDGRLRAEKRAEFTARVSKYRSHSWETRTFCVTEELEQMARARLSVAVRGFEGHRHPGFRRANIIGSEVSPGVRKSVRRQDGSYAPLLSFTQTLAIICCALIGSSLVGLCLAITLQDCVPKIPTPAERCWSSQRWNNEYSAYSMSHHMGFWRKKDFTKTS